MSQWVMWVSDNSVAMLSHTSSLALACSRKHIVKVWYVVVFALEIQVRT